MIRQFFSRSVRRCKGWIAALLLCQAVPAFAEYPELGGPKQFDLICRGQDTIILDSYIFIPMAGPGKDLPKVEKVQKRVTVDLISMQFLESGQYHPMKIPLEKDGILYLYNQRGHRRWTINLDTYKSIFVFEEESGALSVEKMNCKPVKFSGFPFVPTTYDDVLKMEKQKKK